MTAPVRELATPPAPVDRGLLSALAIAYASIGVHDRAARLADAAAHVGRPLTTSAELTAEEARALRRHLPRCSPDTCRHTTAVRMPPAGDRGRSTATVCASRGQEPSAHDQALVDAFARQLASARPARRVHRHDPGCSSGGGHLISAGVGVRHCACGTVADVPPPPGRSCPPAVCYCGGCSWWRPAPPVNYAAAIAQLGGQR